MIKQSRRLPHYCMWCLNGRIWSDGCEGVCITCNAKDTIEAALDNGLHACAEDNDCEYFDWNITMPGADWAKALMDAEDELEIIKTMVVR